MTTNAAAAAPAPTPETPKPPSTSATLGERMEARRRAIRAKSNDAPAPAPEPDAGTGGAPANDNAGKAGMGATAAPDDKAEAGKGATGPDDPSKADAANGNAKAEEAAAKKAERQEAIALAIQRKNLAKRERRIEAREKQFGEQTAKEAAERQRLEELRKTDRIAYIRETTGKSLRELLEEDLKGEKAEPKVKYEDLPPDLRAKLEKIDEFERREKEREARAAEQAEAERKAAGERNGKALIQAQFTDEQADYPHLTHFAKHYGMDTVVAGAWELALSHFNETGEEVDVRRIFAYMEGNAEKERSVWTEPLPAPTVKGGSPNGQTAPSKSASPEPVTMSQSDAASGAPSVRHESMDQKRERIRKRSQSR